MNGSFRQSMSWLHTWSGLVLGGVLYFIFITGTAGYFDTEIDRWMQPKLPVVDHAITPLQMLAVAEQRLNEVAPDAVAWAIKFPVDRSPYLNIWWQNPVNKETGEGGGRQDEKLDSLTGKPVTVRDTGGGQVLYKMHWRLHYIPTPLVYWIVSLCTMFMLVALITGIVVHKKIFIDFFTFRPGKKQRSWLDAHNMLSVLPLPFHLMITYSGLVFLMFTTMPGAIITSYGVDAESRDRFFSEAFDNIERKEAAGISANAVPLSSVLLKAQKYWQQEQVEFIRIENQGDINATIELSPADYSGISQSQKLFYNAVSGELQHVSGGEAGEGETISGAAKFREVIIDLHEGLFAGSVLRWLYFFSGLMGAAMIATGMILWAVKRRTKFEKLAPETAKANISLRFTEQMNVGIIIGLPIAIAVYFWANRLIPAEMAGRADWEVHALFISWGLLLLYPVLRPSAYRAWIELLSLAAFLYGFLPLLNAFTSQHHLATSLLQRDWVMAGFDLTMLAFGIGFALLAIKMHNRQITLLTLNPVKALAKNKQTTTP